MAATTPAPATTPADSAPTQAGNCSQTAAPATAAAAARASSTVIRYFGIRMVARASHTSAAPSGAAGGRSRRARPASSRTSTITPMTTISDSPSMDLLARSIPPPGTHRADARQGQVPAWTGSPGSQVARSKRNDIRLAAAGPVDCSEAADTPRDLVDVAKRNLRASG